MKLESTYSEIIIRHQREILEFQNKCSHYSIGLKPTQPTERRIVDVYECHRCKKRMPKPTYSETTEGKSVAEHGW